MSAEDEFRKVGEDVRELARALRHELRAAQWDAKQAARKARDEFRQEFKQYRKAGYQQWQRPAPPRQPRPPRSPSAPGYRSATVTAPPPVWNPRIPPKPPKVRPKLPPVRHKRDGSTLLSLLLVLVGLAWLVSQTHMFDISLEAVVAAALALLGAGMVVTARTDWSLSRRTWPVWLGATFLLVLVISSNSSAIGDGLSSLTFGPVNATPTTWTEAGGTVKDFAGPITVDLTAVKLSGATNSERLTVRDVFGPVTVTLPSAPMFHVHIDAHTIAGKVMLPTSGDDFGAPASPTVPTLTLDVRTVFGNIAVSQSIGTSSRP